MNVSWLSSCLPPGAGAMRRGAGHLRTPRCETPKKKPRLAGERDGAWNNRRSGNYFLSRAFNAAPRMSPSEAPLAAERDALLLDIHVEHPGADLVALLVILHRLLAGLGPVEVGEMDHAVDVAVEADEQAELGLVLDLAFDGRTDGVLLDKSLPRV